MAQMLALARFFQVFVAIQGRGTLYEDDTWVNDEYALFSALVGRCGLLTNVTLAVHWWPSQGED